MSCDVLLAVSLEADYSETFHGLLLKAFGLDFCQIIIIKKYSLPKTKIDNHLSQLAGIETARRGNPNGFSGALR